MIDKGLAKNPDERYQRGSELATALRGVLAGLKSGAPAAASPATKEITSPTAQVTQPTQTLPPPPPSAPAASAPSASPAPTPEADRTFQPVQPGGLPRAHIPGIEEMPEPDAFAAAAALEPAAPPELDKNETVPVSVPASAPAPAPVPERTVDEAKTVKFSVADIADFTDKMLKMSESASPAPSPAPAPAAKPNDEKTVMIGPEITIPGINDRQAPPAPAMRIEPSQHSGVDHGADAALPPARAHNDETVRLPPARAHDEETMTLPPPRSHDDETMRLEPAANPDATIRLTPKPPEPS